MLWLLTKCRKHTSTAVPSVTSDFPLNLFASFELIKLMGRPTFCISAQNSKLLGVSLRQASLRLRRKLVTNCKVTSRSSGDKSNTYAFQATIWFPFTQVISNTQLHTIPNHTLAKLPPSLPSSMPAFLHGASTKTASLRSP